MKNMGYDPQYGEEEADQCDDFDENEGEIDYQPPVLKSHSEFTAAGRSHPMRGEDVGYQAKVAQDAPASGNLVDDILNGRYEGNNPDSRPESDVDDLLGGGVDDTVADILDDLH